MRKRRDDIGGRKRRIVTVERRREPVERTRGDYIAFFLGAADPGGIVLRSVRQYEYRIRLILIASQIL
jgi:hypothetical protein